MVPFIGDQLLSRIPVNGGGENLHRYITPHDRHRVNDTMSLFRMYEPEEPQERINLLVSRARAALRVWNSFQRPDSRLYKYWAKHLKAETVSNKRSS